MTIVGKICLDSMPKPTRKLRKDECYVSSSCGKVKVFRSVDKAWGYFSKVKK